jgi:hypothetical protein
MNGNAAPWDRIARVVLGLILIAMVFVGPQTPLGWLGLILVGTGLVGYCPLYRACGVSTKHHDQPHGSS